MYFSLSTEQFQPIYQPAYVSSEHRGAHATQVYPSSPAAVNYSSVVRLDLCVRAFAARAASKRKEAIGRCHEMDEGVRGYIRVGKEAGRKRAGRHGEMKRSLALGRHSRTRRELSKRKARATPQLQRARWRRGTMLRRQTRNSSGGCMCVCVWLALSWCLRSKAHETDAHLT